MGQCPLCPFEDNDSYVLSLHVELVHFGQDSPFVVRETPAVGEPLDISNDDSKYAHGERSSKARKDDGTAGAAEENLEEIDDGEYLPCPEDDCGEQVLWRDLQEHLDFHLAEHIGLDERSNASISASSSSARSITIDEEEAVRNRKRRHVSSSSSSRRSRLSRHSTTRQPRTRQRMGRAELGPYAFENQMPTWLSRLLVDGANRTVMQRIDSTGQLYRTVQVENEVPGIVAVVAGLLAEDASVTEAWLCHPSVKHIFKLPNEGGFCGYRNIQMILSFIITTQWTGWDVFAAKVADKSKSKRQDKDKIPNILQLQDMIETGWDMGFNSHSRIETGGIIGTRKYIGTPEVQTLFNSLSIPNGTSIFTDKASPDDPPQIQHAHNQLLDQVQMYFSQGSQESCSAGSSSFSSSSVSISARVHHTQLPPLYLQQPGHSLTIIGIEARADGKRNLLVFDPAYKPSNGIKKLLDRQYKASSPAVSPVKSKLPRSVNKSEPDAFHESNNAASSSSSMPKASVRTLDFKRESFVVSNSPSKRESSVPSKPSSKSGSKSSERKSIEAGFLLGAYRRDTNRLGRHKEFEMLTLHPMHDDSD